MKKRKIFIHRQRNLEQNLPHHHNYEIEEQPKTIRKSTLIYPVAIKSDHQVISIPKATQKMIGIL